MGIVEMMGMAWRGDGEKEEERVILAWDPGTVPRPGSRGRSARQSGTQSSTAYTL